MRGLARQCGDLNEHNALNEHPSPRRWRRPMDLPRKVRAEGR